MKNIIAIILLIGSVLGLYFYTYPKYQEIQALEEQEVEYGEVLSQIDQIESQKAELISRFESISEEEKRKIELSAPDEINVPLAVLDLDGMASNNGILITTVNVEDEAQNGIGELQYVDIGLEFQATFPEFKGFIEEVEKSNQIFDLVEASRSETQDAIGELGDYRIILRAYYLPN